MRSAQRRNRLERSVRKSNLFLIVKILILPVLFLIIFIFIKLTTKYWNGSDKFSIAYKTSSGDVFVTVFDPKLNEEATLIVPGDTQVDVAGNYGTLRIKNVWQLSINERQGGSLLPRTLAKDFQFPVFLWSDSDAEVLKNSDIIGIFKFIISPRNTDIPLGDRVNIAFFALQIKSIDKMEINLGTSKFLQKTILTDGAPGFILNGPVSQRLTVYFSDNDFADGGLRVGIIDATGTSGVSDNVGQVIQVLGGKVVSVDKKALPVDSDCTVLGNNPKVNAKIINIFNCRMGSGTTPFDLEIDLGTKFAKRF